MSLLQSAYQADFYPRPPRGGRPGLPRRHGRHPEISIHALREEGDPHRPELALTIGDFYPRPPRGGRPSSCGPASTTSHISIHALREEGDRTEGSHHQPRAGISIHALREEGDAKRTKITSSKDKFLSTPSARRATKRLLLRWPS